MTFHLPRMTVAELQKVTKRDFAYKLRSINTDLPHETFVGDLLQSVFHVVLDRTHPINHTHENHVSIRVWAWQQWEKSPIWNTSRTRALDFQFPNDNPEIWKNSKLWCEINASKYWLPPLVHNHFTKPLPKIASFIEKFRQSNSKLAKFITRDVAREGFRFYIQSYFPRAQSSITSRLLDEFDIQKGNFVPLISQSCDAQHGAGSSLSSETSRSASSLDKILHLSLEGQKNLLRCKRYVRILNCPQPNLKDSTSKSKVTHLHLESSPTKTTVDVKAIPIKTSSIVILFRSNDRIQRKFFVPSKRIEVMIDGLLRHVQVQTVKTLNDFNGTNWFMSVESMDMTDGTELNTLLQRFFSNRRSLPLSMFRSDESRVLGEGGLFVDCDRLPLSLRKYDSSYLTLKFGATKAVGVEPAATCQICNQPAKGSRGDRARDRELDVQKGLHPHSPEVGFKNDVRDSSLLVDRESSIDDVEPYLPGVEKYPKRKNESLGSLEHAIPLTKRPRTGRSNPDESSNSKHLEPGEFSNYTDPDRNKSFVETDMLSALDAHLEQAQARLRATAKSCRGLGGGWP